MRKNLVLFSIFLLINFIFFEFLFSSINFQKNEYLKAHYIEPEIAGTFLSSDEQVGDLYHGDLTVLVNDLDDIGKPYIIFYETVRYDETDVYVYTKDFDWQFNEEIKQGSYYDWMSDKTYNTMDIDKVFKSKFVFFKVQDYTEMEVYESIGTNIQAFGYYSGYEDFNIIIYILTFAILLIVLITILQIYLENSKEEVIVLKLLGNKTSSIVDRVVKKLLLILTFTFLIISIIYVQDLYIIFKIDSLRNLLLEFLIYYTLSQIIIISICAIYLWINLSRKNVVDMLQGGKYD